MTGTPRLLPETPDLQVALIEAVDFPVGYLLLLRPARRTVRGSGRFPAGIKDLTKTN
jgi:hypothetical protein